MPDRGVNMKRRIIAWILLISFVLLLLNLLVFKVYMEFFSIVYIIIFVVYIFLQGRLLQPEDSRIQSDKDSENTDREASAENEIDADKGSNDAADNDLNSKTDN